MSTDSSIRNLFLVFLSLACMFTREMEAGTTGILEGTIIDRETGQPLLGVSLLIVELRRGTSTNEEGYFVLNNVRAGRYTLRITMVGYQSQTVTDVVIIADRRTKLRRALVPAAIELQAIEVQAEKPLIETNITGTAHLADMTQIDVMPVSTVQEILKWQVGVTQEGNVRGGRSSEVLYLVDGLPVQNFLSGGMGSTVPRSSIIQMSMSTGGFDAEYGNALSGIVNIITRGGTDRPTFLLRGENDSFYGGKQVDHASEVELTLGGPLVKEKLYYFLSGSMFYTDTRFWQDLKESFASPVSRDWNGFSKIDWRVSPLTSVSTTFLFTSQKWHDYEFSWRYNLTGLPLRTLDSYRASALVTSTFSSNAFAAFQLSHYYLGDGMGQGVREDFVPTHYEYDFFLRYILSGARSWWARSGQRITTLKGDYSHQWDANNLFRGGVEFQQYAIESDILRYEPQKTYFGKPLVSESLLDYSTYFSYAPRAGSIYIQNKFEVNRADGLVNVGLRFDFLDPRAERPVIDTVKNERGEYEQLVVGRIPASVKYKLSPRIGVSAPLGPDLFVFINYGEYFQFPLFTFLYTGLDPHRISNGVRAVMGNPDLEPEKTKAWEISLRYAVADELLCTATYFQKQTTNLIDTRTFLPVNSRVAGDYGFAEYINNPFAHASGLELSIARPRGGILTGEISYTLSEAIGMSEYVDQGVNYAQWGFPLPPEEYHLSWDQRHVVKANLRLQLPWGVEGSILYQYASGKPYTWFPSKDGFTSDLPVELFAANNRRMESTQFLDVKFGKHVAVGGGHRPIRLTLFVDARNLLNARNVLWVDSGGRIGGELGDPSAFYPARRVRVGVTMEI